MRPPSLLLACFLALFSLLFGCLPLCAQSLGEPATLSASLFEEWCKATRTRTGRAVDKSDAIQIEPELIKAQEVLIERLRQEKWTTDNSISYIVDAWMEYESPRPNKDGKRDEQGRLFPSTIGLIDKVIPFLQDRRFLQALLHTRKGYFLSLGRRYLEAAESFEKSLAITNPLTLETERIRLGNSVELASLYSVTGSEDKADALYSDVLKFPWYLMKDREAMKDFRELYIRAGSGIIGVRRGDLQKLKALYFVPATQPRLQPELDAAIKEAEAAQPPKK
jgi:tetratricopeptide (TPR) repeat protein